MHRLSLRQAPGLYAIRSETSVTAATPEKGGRLVAAVDDGKSLTIVCQVSPEDDALPRDAWAMLQVEGQTKLDVPGVLLAAIRPISEAKIGVFVLSTYRSDLVFVRQTRLSAASRHLRRAGHRVVLEI